MKIIIDIPKKTYEHIRSQGGHGHFNIQDNDNLTVTKAIFNGKPLFDVTDEQISDAFQLAIANYWESKSKYLTPPPTPCNCPIKKEAKNEDCL